ncbi:MAG: NAD(P)-dependent alcohol dehydrogenase [Dehalococcoidales bacterium]|nr:MAG: NAD(P)-dependent alcohol dehydrogenase [Dehalococcoidales bacterium]
MKAIMQTEYGQPDKVLKLVDIPKPTIGNDEVMVKVHASCINWANVTMSIGTPFAARMTSGGLRKPKYEIPGGDITGTVEAVGSEVTQFQPGDEVYGDLGDSGFRGYAEYVSAPEKNLALKPVNLTFEQAAAVPQAAVVALQGLRNKGNIQPGMKVLINGSSGGIGTYAVQIAKSYDTEVTGVCSTRNADFVLSLGADYIIDYTKEDFTRSEKKYDLVLATAGYRSIFEYKRALSPNGMYVSAGGAMKQVFQGMVGPLVSKIGSRKLTYLMHRPDQKDLIIMKELIEAGKVKPVIDRSYPLEKTADAFLYYAQGKTRGKVVITVGN